MEKLKVLNIASILPFPEIDSKYKLKENDFLIVLKRYFNKKYIDIDFVKVTLYSNRLLAKLNSKWDAYFKMPNEYLIEGNNITAIRRIAFPGNRFQAFSIILSLLVNKKKLAEIASKKYTCIHAHFLYIDGYFAYYLYKKFHIPYGITIRNETKYFKNVFLRYLSNKILNNAKFILTTNIVNKEKLENYTNRNIKVMTHGVDEENFYFNPAVNDNIQITTVCKLNRGKRIDILIEALKKIKDINYTLNIVGDGPEYENLKSISDGLNCIFWGELKHSEVIDQLKKSDIFVLPSEQESFGRVYIEALASSNAVVAVENTGVYGLFEVDKEIMYMKKNSIDSLYDILNTLLKDKEKIKNLKINGYKCVQENYSWSNIAEMYYEIYCNI